VRNATPGIIAASRWSNFLTNETSFDYIAATAFDAEPNGPFLVTTNFLWSDLLRIGQHMRS